MAIRNYSRWRWPPSWICSNWKWRHQIRRPPKNPTLEQNMKWIGRQVAEISPLEIFPTWRWPPCWICSNRKQGCSIRRPRKPYPRTKHQVDRITRCRDMVIRVCWGHMEPPFWGKGKSQGVSDGTIRKSDGSFLQASYRLSIVTVALSETIRPQFAIECFRRSNQQGVGHFGPKFRGVPLGADPSCLGCKERTSQANKG